MPPRRPRLTQQERRTRHVASILDSLINRVVNIGENFPPLTPSPSRSRDGRRPGAQVNLPPQPNPRSLEELIYLLENNVEYRETIRRGRTNAPANTPITTDTSQTPREALLLDFEYEARRLNFPENFIILGKDKMNETRVADFHEENVRDHPIRPIGYKYLHINSKHINQGNSTVNIDLYLTTPITNVKRIALKSFSTPNTGFNIHPNHKIQWLEVGSSMELFEAELTAGYYNNTDLVAHITAQMNALSRTIGSATFTGGFDLTFQDDPTLPNPYYVNMNFTPNYAGSFVFIPNSIQNPSQPNVWEMLGFEQKQIAITDGIVGTKVNGDLLTGITTDMTGKTGAAAGTLDYTANTVSTAANTMGLFITTDLTDNAAYETHLHMGKNSMSQTNILEWVMNDAPVYSYLHYKPENPCWHTLHQPSITHFNMKMLDLNGIPIHPSCLRNWQMVIQVEVEEEIDYHAEVTKKLAAQAWRENHQGKRIY